MYHASRVVRLLNAVAASTIGAWREPQRVAEFVKDWLRAPIRFAAKSQVEAVPAVSLPELLPMRQELVSTLLSVESLRRGDWNVRLDEEILLGLIVQTLQARRIFEIGTYNGRTTRRLAEDAGEGSQVFTLDLTPDQVDRLNGSFRGVQIGEAYRGTPADYRITQLYGDSITFDFSPYRGTMDLVFVDGAHDYPHGLADTRNALTMVRLGGMVLWHDFTPDWPGLVSGILEGAQGLPVRRLSGTALAVLHSVEM